MRLWVWRKGERNHRKLVGWGSPSSSWECCGKGCWRQQRQESTMRVQQTRWHGVWMPWKWVRVITRMHLSPDFISHKWIMHYPKELLERAAVHRVSSWNFFPIVCVELSYTTWQQSQGTAAPTRVMLWLCSPLFLLSTASRGGRLPHYSQHGVHCSILSATATKAHLIYY